MAAEQDTIPTFSDSDKARARQWFAKAKEVFETRNYDYAIECYINGIEQWPGAVEEGHKPLMFVALTRAAAGGKKPGTMDSLRRSTSGKDPVKALVNAEFLMAKDPKSPVYLEAAFKNAARARLDEVAMWVGPMYRDAAVAEKKVNPARFRLLVDTYVEIAERQQGAGNADMGIKAFEAANDSMSRLRMADPRNLNLSKEQTDISTKLTMLRGKYQTATTFLDSVENRDQQTQIHDKERVIQSSDRLDELIMVARREVAQNPEATAKILDLVTLLCRREEDQYENDAIEVLLAAHQRTENYAFKVRADEIRMRQMTRRSVNVRQSGDREAAKRQFVEQLRLELGIFRERMQQYPTDLRIRFEYGKRLFQARKYDDAIPVFQEARNDPKNRTQCQCYLGRCFFEKGYSDQAIDVLNVAIQSYELEGDATSKELHYWLGRAHEAAENKAEALKVFGKLIQWDYNFRDVRERMDNLRSKE